MQPYSQQYQEPILNPSTNFDPTLLADAINGNPLYNIPPTCPTNIIQPDHTNINASTSNHKRRSINLEDDSMEAIDEPPSKQLLSEKNLFKKFGSLNIDGLINNTSKTTNEELAADDDDDADEYHDNRSQNKTTSDKVAQEEFNRYVYLLFKDIEETRQNPFKFSNTTMDRLARDERDKLNKAVILWSPPLVMNRFGNNSDDDDDNNNNTEFRQTGEGPTLADQCDVEFSLG